MGTVKVTNIEPIADNGTVTLGGSGDTITLGSGATVTGNGLVGITMADQWRIITNTNTGTDADVTTNWERNDDASYGSIGTGLTESSGIFSFPQTGIYLIHYNASLVVATNDTLAELRLNTTQDNSTYNVRARVSVGNGGSNAAYHSGSNSYYFDVTNITNDKFKFSTASFSTNTSILGNTDKNRTTVSVIRLGDT